MLSLAELCIRLVIREPDLLCSALSNTSPDIKDICLRRIIGNKRTRLMVLRHKDVPDDIKRKIAVISIETTLINLSFRWIKRRLRSGKKHGMRYYKEIFGYEQLKYYWFGNMSGVCLQANDIDLGAVSWYANGKHHGPTFYQKRMDGSSVTVDWVNGVPANKTEHDLFTARDAQCLALNYESDNPLAREVSAIIKVMAKRLHIML